MKGVFWNLFDRVFSVGKKNKMSMKQDAENKVTKEEKPKKWENTSTSKTYYRCIVCGYIYEGEELPKDFICPWCKHGVEDFEKVVENE